MSKMLSMHLGLHRPVQQPHETLAFFHRRPIPCALRGGVPILLHAGSTWLPGRLTCSSDKTAAHP